MAREVKPYDSKNPPASNVDKAMLVMMLEGYTPEQAIGWIANAQQESYEDLRTQVVGDSGEAIGIFQWHATRLNELKKYAKEQGHLWTDLDTQVRFSLEEPGEKKAHQKLQEAKTVEEAVDAGLAFTRPGAPNRPRRLALAEALQKWYIHG